VGKRRGPVTAKLAINRPLRPMSSVASNAEAPPIVQASEPAVAAGPTSAESVIMAKVAASQAAAGPGPVAGPRIGSPRFVGSAVGDGLLAINPNDLHYQPSIPQPLRRPGAKFRSQLKFCVAADGSVDKVTVMIPSEQTVDNAILEKARLYRFHPYFDQGHPIPFCFLREFRLSIQE
jgi:hypothetical protein